MGNEHTPVSIISLIGGESSYKSESQDWLRAKLKESVGKNPQTLLCEIYGEDVSEEITRDLNVGFIATIDALKGLKRKEGQKPLNIGQIQQYMSKICGYDITGQLEFEGKEIIRKAQRFVWLGEQARLFMEEV